MIEDYPSHYSAYNRRKHRWLRGDWQIAGWLLSAVPDEAGARVPNPISLISRWKILDNLRRSLVEPGTFILLVFGWLAPGIRPVRWTLATVFLLFVPAVFQLIFGVIKAIVEDKASVARDALQSFLTTIITSTLTLIFLAHQTLLSLDAVVRAIVRSLSLANVFSNGKPLLKPNSPHAWDLRTVTSTGFPFFPSPSVLWFGGCSLPR